jgi:hypothetical protein
MSLPLAIIIHTFPMALEHPPYPLLDRKFHAKGQRCHGFSSSLCVLAALREEHLPILRDLI